MAVTDQGLVEWWGGLDEAERAYMLDVWHGRPLPAEARALLDRVPGLTRIRGSFGGLEFEEYMPEQIRAFIRARRDETGWKPSG